MGLLSKLAPVIGAVGGFMVGGPAGAAVGASLGSGIAGASASKKASKAQQQSAMSAIDEQRRQFDLTRQDNMPWLQAGQNALGQLTNPLANFQASPDYQFRRDEGIRGIQQTAAARGGLASGNALKALTQYNSNLASGEFGNWWNRQAGLAGVGQATASSLGAMGQNTAGNIGNALMSGGDARASGIIGGTNALTQGVSGAVDTYNYFSQPRQRFTYMGNTPNDIATGNVYGSRY